MKRLQALTALVLAAALLAGCARGTGTPQPTATPTATPTAEPTPTPTPAPVNNPLTGEQGEGYANQRPVAVSIRTGDGALPQWGVAVAEVLSESVAECKTAGLTAVFARACDGQKASPLGP